MVSHFDLAQKKLKIEELTAQTMQEDFWNDPQQAQTVIRRLNGIREVVENYEKLEASLANLEESGELLKEDMDEDIFMLCEEEYTQMEKDFERFEIGVLLSHEYDQSNAILELHPGAGGTESCDWCSMLYRMYSRYAEKKGFKVTVLDYLPGEEAGIKSVTMLVEGDKAYGYLKAEKGVHRLVRISPFDSGGRRHTSFASLDVMPQFNDEIEIEIRPEDLIVETKRASGAGGQHINKTSSAVRLIHKATGIVVSCQTERSQFQNRDTCMKMLRSRLVELKMQQHAEKISDLKGVQLKIEWGSQIRSYVFMPYQLVKDNRTGYETSNINAVMDGDLDGFINAYLKAEATGVWAEK